MMQVLRVCDPDLDPTCGDYRWDRCDPDDLTCVQQLASTECALLAENDLDAATCVATLAGPEGVCGANACVTDDDCPFPTVCDDYVCGPP